MFGNCFNLKIQPFVNSDAHDGKLFNLLTFALSRPSSMVLSPTKQSSIVLGAATATTPSSQGKISILRSSPSASFRKEDPVIALLRYVDHKLAAIAA